MTRWGSEVGSAARTLESSPPFVLLRSTTIVVDMYDMYRIIATTVVVQASTACTDQTPPREPTWPPNTRAKQQMPNWIF